MKAGVEFAFGSPRYEVSVDADASVPDRAEVFYFPGGSRIIGSIGLLLKLRSEAEEPWFAVFPPGLLTSYSAVFGAPAPTDIFVITQGRGYRVDTVHKTAQSIEPLGIVGALMVPEHHLALFWTPTYIVGHDEHGQRWESSRLSFDGLTVEGVTAGQVVGTAWDARDGSEPRFAVELATGRATGGAPGI